MGLYIDIHTHSPSADYPTPASAGIHPWHAASGLIDEAAMHAAALIGEIGLDYACNVDREVQEHLFREQLSIAQRLRKPVVVHCVRAFEDVMKIVADYHLKAVIFHGFIGSKEQAAEAVKRGYFLSFGEGVKRSPKTAVALQNTPLENLFLETDENTLSIEEIYSIAAEIRGEDTETIINAITNNPNRYQHSTENIRFFATELSQKYALYP